MTKKGATGDFFFIFTKKKKNPKLGSIYLPPEKKWKKKKKSGRPTDHNFSYPLDRKQTFFMGSLTQGCESGSMKRSEI